MIKFPVRVQADPGSTFAHIRDAANKVVAGGLIPIEAEQLVAAANAGAKLQHAQPIEKQPRRKNARQRIADDLKASDVTGLMAERDNIVYGPHDQTASMRGARGATWEDFTERRMTAQTRATARQ